MNRDIRRDRGQWRGCYSFKDIICDGDGTIPRRDGGLKMGQTYYFYVSTITCARPECAADPALQYELDGSTETHDPSLPFTNACPYLPGQTVNTLWVPVEQSLRKRSASLSSMRDGDWKTMNPDDKFATPRPAPSAPATPGLRRIGTAPLTVRHKRSARSLSPSSSWSSFSPRKLFSRKASTSSLRDSERFGSRGARSATPPDDRQSIRSSEGSRSRDISPESLLRFLSDDTPSIAEPTETNDRPSLLIPEDIAEENEDDENFATSTSESMPFTVLSPPPTQHSHSSSSSPVSSPRSREFAVTPPPMKSALPEPPSRLPPMIPLRPRVEIPSTQPQPSLADVSFFMPNSPRSAASNDLPSFYFSEDDEDDDGDETASTNDDEWLPSSPAAEKAGATGSRTKSLSATLSTYSLPRDAGKPLPSTEESDERTPLAADLGLGGGSPALVARNGFDVPVGNASLLTNPIPNSGLHELVRELSWIADVIVGEGS